MTYTATHTTTELGKNIIHREP